MHILYLNCPYGVSEQRILGALVDAGARPEAILLKLYPAGDTPFKLQCTRSTLADALVVSIHRNDNSETDEVGDYPTFIQRLPLRPSTGRILLDTLDRLAATGGKNGAPGQTVRVEEVWTLAAIGAALDLLEVEGIRASSVGMGMAGDTDRTFVPQPRLAQLSVGMTIHPVPCGVDLSTPAGLAFLTTAASEFSPLPAMQLVASGCGAGPEVWPVPNILQAFIGEVSVAPEADRVAIVETNIDDMPAQAFDHVMGLLFERGALDVYFTPIGMKKNRPATMLSVICSEEALEPCIEVILRETTTLGVRISYADRRVLARKFLEVESRYGRVSVKAALLNGRIRSVTPEYDDCHTLALQNNIPLRTVQDAATEAAWTALRNDGQD